uniref:Leucine-rich repeat-containing protein 14 n=4 Tax=Callithrix jacchus TaxID=9483 RepID=F7GFR2_CALJA
MNASAAGRALSPSVPGQYAPGLAAARAAAGTRAPMPADAPAGPAAAPWCARPASAPAAVQLVSRAADAGADSQCGRAASRGRGHRALAANPPGAGQAANGRRKRHRGAPRRRAGRDGQLRRGRRRWLRLRLRDWWLSAWPSAMHTLVFLSTRQVLQCQPAACQALPLLPRELFPLLFKVAFMDKKTVVLRELVHTWPFPLLSFQQLLQECAHCSRALLQERPSTESMQAVILGLTARLHTPEPGASTQPLCRKHVLRVLDMTGLLDDGVEQDPGTMSMWDCTAAVARTCIAQQQGGATEPGPAPVPVEVRVDLRVNRASYAFLREALRSSVGSPLRLCCRDLRAEDLPMRNTVALLQLLDAGCLRRVDLRFNNLGLRGLSVIIPHVARFQHLASLRLHYVHGDSRQPSVDGEDNFRYFLAQMGRFTCLRELSMGSSLLSGRLDQLLSTLQSPLESLELAFCALLPEDLSFLARSPHAAHLKKLDLSGNDLSGSQLAPFQGLLKASASTLLHLELTECQLADTQLLATLPILTRCAHLRYLGLYGNPLSMAGLKELLRDSVVQAELRTVVHPFPVDCYEGLPWPPPASVLLEASINEEKFARVEAELHQLLLASGRAHVLWTTDIYGRLAADYFSL